MHEKSIWFNDNIQYMFHENIVEYDMVAASLQISRRFNLLDDSLIDQLLLLPKEKRTKKVGLIQKDNTAFSEQLISGIRDIRRKFIETNGLTEDEILSLHSDAIFFASKKDIKTTIEGVEFKHKNTWSSYVRYDKIEMFYDGNQITYKGVSQDLLHQQTLGLCKYLTNVFDKLENYDVGVLDYLCKFQTQYLQDKLPEYCYMSFARRGEFKMENVKLLAFMTNVVLADMRRW